MLLTFDDMLQEAVRTKCTYRSDYGTFDIKRVTKPCLQLAPDVALEELLHSIETNESCWRCDAQQIDIESFMKGLRANEFVLTYNNKPILAVAVKENEYCCCTSLADDDEDPESETDEDEDLGEYEPSEDSYETDDDAEDEDDTCSGCCNQCQHCHCHDDSDEEDDEYDDDDPDNENVISINYNGTNIDISLAALDHILTRILEHFDSED